MEDFFGQTIDRDSSGPNSCPHRRRHGTTSHSNGKAIHYPSDAFNVLMAPPVLYAYRSSFVSRHGHRLIL